MKIIKDILKFLIYPFRTFGLGKFSDKIVDVTKTRKYIVYILSFIIALMVVFIKYFI